MFRIFVVIFFLLIVPNVLWAAEQADVLFPEMISDDPVLSSMFDESVDVAIDSIKIRPDGSRFLSAGPGYDVPARTYYRDSYWTSGLVLLIDPTVIREQILLLATGIEADGSVPSALTVDADGLKIPLWVDHHDSGPFFIMMVYDYLRFTGDQSILDVLIGQRSIYVLMEDVLTHLQSLDRDGNFLPEKPANSLQDWLDTIPRGGEVLYDEILYYRALRNMVEMSELREYSAHATVFHRHSLLVRHQINTLFWHEPKGYFFERCENGLCVDRLTNESSLAVLYEVIPPSRRDRFLTSLKQLETDWGVVNAIPAYPGFTVNRYQNMTDWPVLDGMNAGARLKFYDEGWYQPLTKWWTYFDSVRLEGEKLPEFISPTDLSGGRSQAWSVNPIVSFIRYGLGVDPDLQGQFTVKPSPTGEIQLKNIMVRGQRITLQANPKQP